MNVIKHEAPLAVNTILEAGICVTLVTGDNITTAKQVAKECGIVSNVHLEGENKFTSVIEGPEFGKIYEEGRHEEL